MKIIFMGTPDFAVGTLEKLIGSEHEVCAVVTQPDKQKGRGKIIRMTPVKEAALRAEIPVYQPAKVREAEFLMTMEQIDADVIVVVAFGQIIPEKILTMKPYGCINVHASLLPKYRGAAPIQWAVINGEKESGVTTMQMDSGLDTGDILLQSVIPLDQKETGGSLFEKLDREGAKLLLKTLDGLQNKSIQPVKQGETTTEYAKMLKKDMGQIDWDRSAIEIERLIRGLNPWPSAFSHIEGKTLKIWEADVLAGNTGEKPGTVVKVSRDSIHVQSQDGQLVLKELQLEGKKRMDTRAFLHGFQMKEGVILC